MMKNDEEEVDSLSTPTWHFNNDKCTSLLIMVPCLSLQRQREISNDRFISYMSIWYYTDGTWTQLCCTYNIKHLNMKLWIWKHNKRILRQTPEKHSTTCVHLLCIYQKIQVGNIMIFMIDLISKDLFYKSVSKLYFLINILKNL